MMNMRTNRSLGLGALALVTALTLSSGKVSAGTFGFEYVGGSFDGAVVTNQLFLDVLSTDNDGEVAFVARNTGPIASTITGVYIEAATSDLSALIELDDSDSGVDFQVGGDPTVFPTLSVAYHATATPPPATNGVDPGEFVTLILTTNYSVAEISQKVANFDIRVGFRVQSIGDDGVSTQFVAVPEPSTIAMTCLGLLVPLGVAGVRRWWRQSLVELA